MGILPFLDFCPICYFKLYNSMQLHCSRMALVFAYYYGSHNTDAKSCIIGFRKPIICFITYSCYILCCFNSVVGICCLISEFNMTM